MAAARERKPEFRALGPVAAGPTFHARDAADDPRCVLTPDGHGRIPAPVVVVARAPRSAGVVADQATTPLLGMRLAAAAHEQLGGFVIYNEAYRRISYPMGDVAPLYGVCTDVVIRAFRGVGIDLQVAVKLSGVGRGDTNIDHRRTDVLRRLFERAGAAVPVTSFAEDYLPGDIVTYARPQNSGSRSHIAMVSSVRAPSGRPMIVHNRGWGPMLEDALFVDAITGHYRIRDAGPLSAIERAAFPPANARGVRRTLAGAAPAATTTARRLRQAGRSERSTAGRMAQHRGATAFD
ncbi:MAG: DUF1287 domain-containing protein [Hyphomicrobiaceae bacterium]|nr:DUF1287 domain-containing protein [Hyphomicrobiaceae bacterium]